MWCTCDAIEFVAAWEKDVLESKWNEQYDKISRNYKRLILKPDFHSDTHKRILMRLAKNDGILKHLTKRRKYVFYKKILSEKEFLNLKWCNILGGSIDEIDLITSGSRKVKDILGYIKLHKADFRDHEYIIKNIVRAEMPRYDTNRLYVINGTIVDGNHRAASNIMSIYNDRKYFPMTCYKAVKVVTMKQRILGTINKQLITFGW